MNMQVRRLDPSTVSALRQAFLMEGGDDHDAAAFNDFAEGETDLHEVLAEAARSALQDEAMAHAMKQIIEENKGRQARLESRAERKRAAIATAMDECGLEKLGGTRAIPDITITHRVGPPGAAITDESLLPEGYLRIKREPNKSLINAAIKDGFDVPGVVKTNGKPILTIRTA